MEGRTLRKIIGICLVSIFIAAMNIGNVNASEFEEEKIVVVIDAGHDKKHDGAYGNGVKESTTNLKIAKYCKEELEKYMGVEVYLTRTDSSCPYPKSKDNRDDVRQRVRWADKLGADAYVSMHLNASSSSKARGAEVYYPKKSSKGKALAQNIQNELVKLGLYDRKIHTNETLMTMQTSNKCGVPTVIVEHAFVSNSADVKKYLKTSTSLKKLGVADAKGIARQFNLVKPEETKKIAVKNAKPTMLSATQLSGTLTIEWEKVDKAYGYYVYRKVKGGSWKKLATVKGGNSLSYKDKTFIARKTYEYKVKAYRDGVTSAYSNTIKLSTVKKPKFISLKNYKDGLKLRWNRITYADGYLIYRKRKGEDSWKKIVVIENPDTLSYFDQDVRTGNTYYYRIRAYGEDVKSSYSSSLNKKVD